MKLSRYSEFVFINGKDLLFNAKNDAIIAVAPELKQLIEANAGQLEPLERQHPELYRALDKCGFIVSEQSDEYEQLRSRIIADSEDMSSFHLTINPTMNCNFHCWYCYEDHVKGTKMDRQTISSINRLITNILESSDTDRLVMSFFGGEPLMHWKDVAVLILDWAESEAKRLRKKLDVYATTNGYFLTEDVVNRLAQCSYASIQVPFDGGREVYDSIKFTKKKESSYDRVLSNVIYAVDHGVDVTVRCNYTSGNLESFAELAENLSCLKDRTNIRLDFHRIWQEKNTIDLEERFEKLYDELRRSGIPLESPIPSRGTCYADKRASAVINYNGDVYKCTARKFDRNTRLGKLGEDGTIEWNAVALDRGKCKYHSSSCRGCLLFPICLQSCSQEVFEGFSEDTCTMNYSAEDIKRVIIKRVRHILKEKSE